jgi:uncharacterized protein (TIGR02246 family)
VIKSGKELTDFATRYTAAWCSQDPPRVATFYAPDGSLTINEGIPNIGRDAIAESARGFMTAFPDMIVTLDDLASKGGIFVYHWTLIGTNTGPGGTGKRVRISGREEWRFSSEGLIAESKGYFDEAEFQRQLQTGAPPVM